jgi:hypothetical protein
MKRFWLAVLICLASASAHADLTGALTGPLTGGLTRTIVNPNFWDFSYIQMTFDNFGYFFDGRQPL